MEVGKTDVDVFDEAARWLARVQEAPLCAADERALKAWLAADRRNAEAMDVACAVWEMSDDLGDAPALVAERRRALTLRLAGDGDFAAANDAAPAAIPGQRRWRALAAAAASLALVVTAMPPPAQAFETARGQSLQAVLADGSRITLNTDSRVVVDYGWFSNTISIEKGEAEVTPASGPGRPLRIAVNGTELWPQGSVAVRDLGSTSTVLAVAAPVELRQPGAAPVLLGVAERGTVMPGRALAVGRANPAQALAWQQGQVIFDHTDLASAAAEFARYGDARLIVAADVRDLKVSGAYRTSDIRAFLDALPAIHPVRWHKTTAGEIRIESADTPA
jgi:transmembrane sensor